MEISSIYDRTRRHENLKSPPVHLYVEKGERRGEKRPFLDHRPQRSWGKFTEKTPKDCCVTSKGRRQTILFAPLVHRAVRIRRQAAGMCARVCTNLFCVPAHSCTPPSLPTALLAPSLPPSFESFSFQSRYSGKGRRMRPYFSSRPEPATEEDEEEVPFPIPFPRLPAWHM